MNNYVSIGSYDIETCRDALDKHIPYCVCFYFNKKYSFLYYKNNSDIIYTSIKNIFKKNLLYKSKKIILYIHNLNYDGFFILHTVTFHNMHFETFMEKCNIYSISIFLKDVEIVFKCSYKLLPSSLKNISKSFNLKDKLPFPYSLINILNIFNKKLKISEKDFNSIHDYLYYFKIKGKDQINVKKYTIRYCIRDVEITYSFIIILRKIILELNIDIIKIFSSPSLALKIFLKIFNKKNVSFSFNQTMEKYLRSSYYGGRCEVYGNPYDDEYIYHFDFPGMYGICMKEKFPYGKWRVETDIKDFTKPGFYSIEYESNMYIPCLPFHDPVNGKLLFLNGKKMCGNFYFEEIINFIKNGGKVKKILYGIVFDEYDYIFNEYVDFFNEFRKKGYEYKTFGKLMVNSLYGRMGMESRDTHTFFTKDLEIISYIKSNLDIISIKELNNYYLIESSLDKKLYKKLNIEKKKKIKNNISLAAAITSKARILLNIAQNDVIKNGGRILYSDTDSIFASYKKNVINQKHGIIFWDGSKDDTEIDDCFFINPKTYGILYKKNNKESIKIKGLNEKNISFYDLKKKFYDNEVLNINKFSFIDKKDLTVKTSITEKIFDLSKYDKRIFNKDKKETTAILI